MSDHLAPFAAMLTHPVQDVDRWKAFWDRHDEDRRDAGILAHHINRAEDDPNLITVFMPLTDLDRARRFATSPERSDEMERSGVAGPPEILWLEPVRDSAIWDRRLPALILRARVADVDTWLATYDGAGELLSSMGMVGAAASRSVEDPELVVAYRQAETFGALRESLADPQLEGLMEKAGVLAPPEVRFCTGGWARSY